VPGVGRLTSTHKERYPRIEWMGDGTAEGGLSRPITKSRLGAHKTRDVVALQSGACVSREVTLG
jgi:hypothetical protein